MKNLGPLFIISAAILWAFDGILRRSLFELPPIIIVFWEHALGATILLPLTLKQLAHTKLSSKHWTALTWIALLSGVAGTLWFTTALVKTEFIPFSVVFLLQKLQPIFAIATARLLLREKLPSHFLLWASLAIVSAYFVTFPTGSVNLTSSPQTLTAALYAAGAAFAWGSSTSFSRMTLLDKPHTLITGLRFIFTTLIAFPLVFYLGVTHQLATITFSHFTRLLTITLSTGMFALWIYYRGLKTTEAKTATILELAFPLTALAIDHFFYQTTLTHSQYAATATLLLSILRISNQSTKYA